jgi:hypothetical protein
MKAARAVNRVKRRLPAPLGCAMLTGKNRKERPGKKAEIDEETLFLLKCRLVKTVAVRPDFRPRRKA